MGSEMCIRDRGSAVASIDLLKAKGAANIRLLCILGSPEGVEAVTNAHSDTDILLGGLDPRLNEKGYIVPGLGDAGLRRQALQLECIAILVVDETITVVGS